MNKENIIIGSLTGLIAWCVGLPWQLMWVWLMLMICDIISGIIKSCINSNFSSREMKLGLFRKSYDVIIMITLILLQYAINTNGITIPIGSAIIGFFIFKEVSSIMENYISCGGKVPDNIKKYLRIAQEQFDNKDNKNDKNSD